MNLRGPSSDVTAPSFSLISVNPNIVNRGGSTTIRWSASDPTGIKNTVASGWYMTARFHGSLYDDKDLWFQESAYTDTVLVSGDLRNGIFETVLEVPFSSTPFSYTLTITATDWRGNTSWGSNPYWFLRVE
ncbi:MAG: hypothetical protein HN348_30365 [Proteobacteria bacterium]|nr:hypothetical protein [Pseudomonadota bacterium]